MSGLLTIYHTRKGSNAFERALIDKLQEVVTQEPELGGLHLFTALSIYRCSIQEKYRGDPDLIQVNLIKRGRITGVKILRVGRGKAVEALTFTP